ncbi:MAG TPA: sigma 54-interacting transcriptional regulator [Candidatus Polarisedimenticolaceae bacterium]|nr:sigma 54-interacting transcriptional regulator [Candidatus Polarisedimenticolaceae bacterium]
MERYRRIGRLGVGGAGRVDLVEDRLRPGSRLALKELLDADPESTAQLTREFATLASLRHPSLVEVHELEIDASSGRPRLLMEYVEGTTLVDTIKREGPASLLPIVAETLRALAFLHDFGLVHRDLKPGNILIRTTAKAGHRVVVLDFGLAAERHAEQSADGAALGGTLPYMAPELFDGEAPSKRTDLYALGVVIFEAIHGRTPFVLKGQDMTGFVTALREGRRARPAPPAGFPAGFGRWLDALLASQATDRPSSATDALARLNEASAVDFPLETGDDRAARLGSGPPVGRDDVLAALGTALEPGDAPRVIWLCGDAGSGKSRLLRHVAGEAVGAGRRVHAPPGALPDDADAFVERVRADARQAPTIVLLDEMERADNAVATFVDRIAREPREAPVRVVVATRPGELTHPKLKKLLADTGIVPSLTRIDLAPLTDAGLKAMIERASAGRSSAQARVKWLADASEGNAGAAESLIVEGVWEKRGKVPVATALLQSIRRRLDVLSAEARAWLEALAVLGDDAPEPLVGELAGLEDQASRAADEALAAGLARRTGATLSPDSRRAVDAITAAASPERLRQLHSLAATHFATFERDTFGVVSWRLARHWRGAGDLDRSLAAALDSASAAEVATNWEEAATRLRFALTLLPRRDPRRADLWPRYAEALRQAMLHREAVRAFGSVARWAKDEASRLEARAMQAQALMMAGRWDAALVRAEQLRVVGESGGISLPIARAFYIIATIASQHFEQQRSLDCARRGLALLSDEPSGLRADLLATQFMAESRLGEPDASKHFDEARSLARSLGMHYRETLLLVGRAMYEERASNFSEQRRFLEEARALAMEQRSPVWLRYVSSQLARLALIKGELDRARTLSIEAEELALYSGALETAANFAEGAIFALLIMGRPLEAQARARHWLESGRLSVGTSQYLAMTLTLAEVLLAIEEPDFTLVDNLLEQVETRLERSSHSLRVSAMSHRVLRDARDPSVLKDSLCSTRLEAELRNSNETLSPLVAARAHLVLARNYLRWGLWDSFDSALNKLFALSSESALPYFAAEGRFLRAARLSAAGYSDEADAERRTGRRLFEVTATRIGDADCRNDFLTQRTVRDLMASAADSGELRRLTVLYEMIRALNSEVEPESILETSLELSMRAVGAERGMILLSGPTGADFSVRLSKNLEQETQADAEAFSRRIVQQAEQGEPVLALDAGQDDRFKDFKSVSLFRIRSLMCVPLRSRGRIIGTVYLDSRRQGRPFRRDDLRFVEAFADHAAIALENARRRAELELENKRLRAAVGERAQYSNIVGRSLAMQRVFDLLERIADSDVTVLVQGESGTGKELVARALHFSGPRKDKVFLSENCAAITESLLESELFGHIKGAFTGADKDRAGLFEQAHGGTLFLDEVGDMSPAMQARLLRVLQEGELRRVGGDSPIRVDVRVIAATNKNLQVEVAAGRFREDLYYRLAVVVVELPPLRERIGDVPFLANHLSQLNASARKRPAPRIDGVILDAMEKYAWPGNVRQLENLLRRMTLLAGDGAIDRTVIDSDPELSRIFFGNERSVGPMLSLEKTEQEQIRRALDAAAGNRDRAARLLGISRATIYRKMREYDLH